MNAWGIDIWILVFRATKWLRGLTMIIYLLQDQFLYLSNDEVDWMANVSCGTNGHWWHACSRVCMKTKSYFYRKLHLCNRLHLTDLFFFYSETWIQDEIIYVLVICAFINVCFFFLIKQGYFGLINPFFVIWIPK